MRILFLNNICCAAVILCFLYESGMLGVKQRVCAIQINFEPHEAQSFGYISETGWRRKILIFFSKFSCQDGNEIDFK